LVSTQQKGNWFKSLFWKPLPQVKGGEPRGGFTTYAKQRGIQKASRGDLGREKKSAYPDRAEKKRVRTPRERENKRENYFQHPNADHRKQGKGTPLLRKNKHPTNLGPIEEGSGKLEQDEWQGQHSQEEAKPRGAV